MLSVFCLSIRLIHGGVNETHVFHLHNHQWRLEPDDPKSTIIDSISISPQECYTLDILYGAGSFNGMIGDAIFHCHLYPHFHEGMRTLWRVFDRLQDGSGRYPDGTPIEALMLPRDRPLPPKKDSLHRVILILSMGALEKSPYSRRLESLVKTEIIK